MTIRWNEPRVNGEEEKREVLEVLDANYINEGPKSKKLEEEIKGYLGVKHVILTTNATVGLYLALKGDAILKGKNSFEAIVPDLTMFATASSVGEAGGRPVLVDVDSRGTIDYRKIEEKINKKTTAIVSVHVLGRSANMSEIEKIAKAHNLTIIEDAAGSLGSKDSEGFYHGTRGKAGVYSLQSNKIVTCGQGGVVVTNNGPLYEIIRRLRDFGRMSNKEFLHVREGYNHKFNDILAAVALAQFRKIGEKKEMLLSQDKLYREELKGVNQVRFHHYEKDEIPLWVDTVVQDRSELVKHLNQKDIFPREFWPAVHQNPPYKSQAKGIGESIFPVSTYIANNGLWLPNGPAITEREIKIVSDEIKRFYNG